MKCPGALTSILCLVVAGSSVARPPVQDRAAQAAGPVVPSQSVLDADEEAALHAERSQAAPHGLGVARGSYGAHWYEGRIFAGGPDYKAFFERGSFEFTPAFGRTAARNYPVRFTLDSIAVGAQVVHSVEGAGSDPLLSEELVRYELADGIEERYEVRRDGVHQTFVFDSPFEASGDLVVRGRLDTSLVPRATADGGLAFEAADLGAVTMSGVVGIDAEGESVAGSMRLEDGVLELVLPAEFVASASYPLTLDPFVGTQILVAASFDDADPDVAYDATNDLFLVVWERDFGGLDIDIRAQRVAAGGGFVGGLLGIESGAAVISFDPVVANVNLRDRFLVGYLEGGLFGPFTLFARSVEAGTGLISARTTVASNTLSPAASSEATTVDDECMLVWEDTSAGGIRYAQVNLPPAVGGTPVPFGAATLSTNPDDSRPKISRSGGSVGQHLVVWQRFFSSGPDNDLRVALVTRNSAILQTEVFLAGGIPSDEEDPACDGDGTTFVAVFERDPTNTTFDNDIVCVTVAWTGTFLAVGTEVVIEGDPGDDEVNPAIGFNGETFTVTWSDEAFGGAFDVGGATVTWDDCAICESEFELVFGISTGDEDLPAVGTAFSGGGTSDTSFVVWEDVDTVTFDGDVFGQLTTSWGVYQDLGGGCGAGGRASAPCARIGNTNFSQTLTAAPTLVTAFLIVGFEELNLACGACTLVPDPFSGFVFATMTNSLGIAAVPMEIPSNASLVGLGFYQQWAVDSGAGCSIIGADLSNANHVTIQG